MSNFTFINRGVFTNVRNDSILDFVEKSVSKTESSKIKKRIYSILVESLQNVTRHQEDEDAFILMMLA